MKIRTDFVTNSSSSSFILGFSSEETVLEELINGFPRWAFAEIGTVIDDVKNADKLSKEEVVKKIYEEMKYDAEYEVEKTYRKRTGCSYVEAYEYLKTQDGMAEVRECIDNFVKEIVAEMSGKSIFVEISYSDNHSDIHSQLEHEIMPNVDSTIVCFNHH